MKKLNFISWKWRKVNSTVPSRSSPIKNHLLMISIKYRYSDTRILLTKTINFIDNRLFCCNHTCYCIGMVFMTSRYVS